MMKKILLLVFVFGVFSYLQAQNYDFKVVVDNDATPVISQGRSGTCWSFATSSFLESEIKRITGEWVDISEMYSVRVTYEDKAWAYVMRQGKIQFGEGGLAHDVIHAVASGGIVPDAAFDKMTNSKGQLDHSGLVGKMKKIMDDYIKNGAKEKNPRWKQDIDSVLDRKVGRKPVSFTYNNKVYTPKEFQNYVHIKPEDYITLTSFTHKPYYENFILNIPDNYSNGSFLNLPLDELVDVSIEALKKGYTLALDADVSEPAFSAKYGIAVLPEDERLLKKSMTEMVDEIVVTPALRQKEFENFHTTDDHLMHITGLVKDAKGRIYFKVKNSWGHDSKRVGNGGYIYMSEAYFRMKAISVMLHRSALPCNLLNRIK